MRLLAVTSLGLMVAFLAPVSGNYLVGDLQATQRPTFKATADLVTVSAVVRDKRGRLVTGLTKSDFDVIDNDTPREIVDFRSDRAPVQIALLIDSSGSMGVGDKSAEARDAVMHVVSWLDAKDQVALVTFDREIEELQPFMPAPGEVLTRLKGAKAFGSTSLYDAIAATSQRVAARGFGRRAVVAITDGLDTSSQLTAEAVSALASAIDVPAYIIAVVSPLDHPGGADAAPKVGTTPESMPANRLADLARWTGGEFFISSTPAHASAAARRIVDELRQQYLIAFTPDDRPGWHRLAIKARDDQWTVRARSGYQVEPLAVTK